MNENYLKQTLIDAIEHIERQEYAVPGSGSSITKRMKFCLNELQGERDRIINGKCYDQNWNRLSTGDNG